jgi:DNA-binding transcriptional LysR family regulator
MDLHYLKIFDTVASLKSFTKASEQLHISQSALSIQMKRFEAGLGLKLFDRVGNRISLNENGKLLFEYSQAIFNMVTQAEYKLLNNRDFITGTIQIGASNTPGTYILPNVIAQYKKLYPEVKINLTVGNTSEITQSINNGSLDFAINSGYIAYHKEVIVDKIADDVLILAASPRSKYARLEHIGTDELKDMDFVLHKTESQLYTCYKNFMEERKLPERVSITMGNIDAIKRAVIADIGVSLIPQISAVLELQAGFLVKLPLDGKPTLYPYNLVYNVNRYLPLAAERFISLLRQYVSGLDLLRHAYPANETRPENP